MAIPRLPAATSPYTLTVDINVTQRPYFEKWYNRAKEDGESPAEFSLRILRERMLTDYIMSEQTLEAVDAEALLQEVL